VLAFDFRNNGHSAYPTKNPLAYRRDFAAAIKQLRSGGARRVFLIGASMGGAAAVQNSGGLPLTGVVSLSGTRALVRLRNQQARPPRPARPFLYLSALYASAPRARQGAPSAHRSSSARMTANRRLPVRSRTNLLGTADSRRRLREPLEDRDNRARRRRTLYRRSKLSAPPESPALAERLIVTGVDMFLEPIPA
jgi:pimeloyl-ACP methyl ester carboxylesterase